MNIISKIHVAIRMYTTKGFDGRKAIPRIKGPIKNSKRALIIC
jgi:hypothetical protein